MQAEATSWPYASNESDALIVATHSIDWTKAGDRVVPALEYHATTVRRNPPALKPTPGTRLTVRHINDNLQPLQTTKPKLGTNKSSEKDELSYLAENNKFLFYPSAERCNNCVKSSKSVCTMMTYGFDASKCCLECRTSSQATGCSQQDDPNLRWLHTVEKHCFEILVNNYGLTKLHSLMNERPSTFLDYLNASVESVNWRKTLVEGQETLWLQAVHKADARKVLLDKATEILTQYESLRPTRPTPRRPRPDTEEVEVAVPQPSPLDPVHYGSGATVPGGAVVPLPSNITVVQNILSNILPNVVIGNAIQPTRATIANNNNNAVPEPEMQEMVRLIELPETPAALRFSRDVLRNLSPDQRRNILDQLQRASRNASTQNAATEGNEDTPMPDAEADTADEQHDRQVTPSPGDRRQQSLHQARGRSASPARSPLRQDRRGMYHNSAGRFTSRRPA